MSDTPSPQTHTTESSIPVRKIFLAAYLAMAVWSLWYVANICYIYGASILLAVIQDAGLVLLFATAFVLASTIFGLVALLFLSIRVIPLWQRKLYFCLATTFWYVPLPILRCTRFTWGDFAVGVVFLPAPLAFLFFLWLLMKSERN